MPIATLAEFRAALTSGPELCNINIDTATVIAGRHHDMWTTSRPAGVAPTASVVPTNDTLGALGQRNGGTGVLGSIAARFNSLSAGVYLIADRLAHSGGLSGTVATAQTTNLPTAALTRYTTGAGVMAALTIYTAVGATGTTVSATYTNSAGTGSRVSPLVAFGGTGFNAANRMIMLPLQADDAGVRSVQSVTVTATTATAGNFGVTLFRPICVIAVESVHAVANVGFISGGFCGGLNEIVDGACLFPIAISTGANAAGSGALILEEW